MSQWPYHDTSISVPLTYILLACNGENLLVVKSTEWVELDVIQPLTLPPVNTEDDKKETARHATYRWRP